jgi:sugar O-acyltransferase (sialic acid O-acetyltransferase NeuD family)
MSGILLLGAGALARDIIDCFGSDRFAGLYVDPAYPATSLADLPVFTRWDQAAAEASTYLLAISGIEHRNLARAAAREAGLVPAAPLISSRAVVAADAAIASGSAIGHMAVIGPTALVDEDVLVMHGANVGHDCVIGANSVLCAGANISGNVRIGRGSFIGPSAVVTPNLEIGEGCHLAGGAVCLRHAPPGTRWIGNPARLASR